MKQKELLKLNPKENIIIKGAHLHNLKNIDVVIPRNKLVVITGVSGSGKSSLAFDTLYAEGQRRYVESLSSYARQFLGRIDKPKVDYIKGISPAVAIEQKVNTTNARSTVGTSTEIYDYLKLLFARIGKIYSPVSGNIVQKDSVTSVIEKIKTLEENSKWYLLAPLLTKANRTLSQHLRLLLEQGFSRVLIQSEPHRLDQLLESDKIEKLSDKDIFIVVDRMVVKTDEEFYNRLADAIQSAFYEGKGNCLLQEMGTGTTYEFSNKLMLDGLEFTEPNVHLFSFNNPYGACSSCNGFGTIIGIDQDLVIPNTSLSIYEKAVFPWRGESMSSYNNRLLEQAHKFDFPVHIPYFELTTAQKNLLWNGNSYFTGIHSFFKELEQTNYKIQNRVLLSRYRGKTLCPTCQGKRLKPEANYIKIAGKSISDLVDLPISELQTFFNSLKLNAHDAKVSKRLLLEINNRIDFLCKVGLPYLSLNRNSHTLSGGESQRINLATSLGSSLVGSMYILDEPSIGVHPRDTENLISVLKNLRDLGNTVIVVEHDEDLMKAADYIIDIGPEAGYLGGELVAEGSYDSFVKQNSLTANYLLGKLEIPVPKTRRLSTKYIEIIGARENNLKNINVKFPLDCLTMITGVSGSGKSTLVKKILLPVLQKKINGTSDKPGQHTRVSGDLNHVQHIEYIDQNPIGKSSRSNPITYIKAYDDIRNLFSGENLSKLRNYQPKHFSFNVDGGRCEVCKGEGEVTIEMQFMADVHLPCQTCNGKRFKKEILEVSFQGKNIHDILEFTVDEAFEFFTQHKQEKIAQKIQPLQAVGLGYVKLGQSSSTLSGGEAQRIKLATFLAKGNTKEKTLFIFDEPTTGLHFHDVNKLLTSFEALLAKGHSIIVIEHHLDMIKSADYIIDMGPKGGDEGGFVVAEGTPEMLVKNKKSITGTYLKEKL